MTERDQRRLASRLELYVTEFTHVMDTHTSPGLIVLAFDLAA